jgi:hypothetical protein
MSNQAFESVWDAIEDTPEQAATMKRLSALRMKLKSHAPRSAMTYSFWGTGRLSFLVRQPGQRLAKG